jgi:hypothetical protein
LLPPSTYEKPLVEPQNSDTFVYAIEVPALALKIMIGKQIASRPLRKAGCEVRVNFLRDGCKKCSAEGAVIS